ncbi:hypothetical protein cce_4767 [Crocosphaera subtropica ATCC 51142]|uniref:Uncharacterized protein n=2 Tax=Crocosphaera TaxID=263510 RepID=B1X1V4_CROS5|nr:hypothetical protein cce_4767 [Crocosphaera subtropica ATCC 51142]
MKNMTATQTKQSKTSKAMELLEEGISNLLQSGDWRQYLQVQSQFHNYSFNNIVLIVLQYPKASRVAGYRKWQELGRQVKKGSKAIKILAPLTKKIEKENDNGEKQKINALVGFRTVNVFDVSQTEGEELPAISSSVLNGDDQGLLERLKAFSLDNKVPVKFEGILGGANGCCRYDTTTGNPIEITVDPLLPPLHQAKTLAHEIAHSLLHSRKQYDSHIPRSMAELEAESTAFLILKHFGLDSGDYSFPYVACWQEGEDAIANLRQAGTRLQKAANQVIDWVESHSNSD